MKNPQKATSGRNGISHCDTRSKKAPNILDRHLKSLMQSTQSYMTDNVGF